MAITDASPALTPNSAATCGSSGSATRTLATEANEAMLSSTMGRTIEGALMGPHEASRAALIKLRLALKNPQHL